MQPDFEPVIERKYHNYINCIEGVYHTGQRDMQRIRISIDAFNAGFKIKHIGEVLYASVKNGSITQIHSKHPHDVIGSCMMEYSVTCSRAPWENF